MSSSNSPIPRFPSGELLFAALRQAINDSETAAGSPDDLLTLQALAAVEVVDRLGFVEAHGVEYAVKAGDVTLAAGFHTLEQAEAVAPPGSRIVRRWVGVWEPPE